VRLFFVLGEQLDARDPCGWVQVFVGPPRWNTEYQQWGGFRNVLPISPLDAARLAFPGVLRIHRPRAFAIVPDTTMVPHTRWTLLRPQENRAQLRLDGDVERYTLCGRMADLLIEDLPIGERRWLVPGEELA
jgi:hypothetical protein